MEKWRRVMEEWRLFRSVKMRLVSGRRLLSSEVDWVSGGFFVL